MSTVKVSYADVLKTTSSLLPKESEPDKGSPGLTPVMKRLIETHNFLKSHSNDSLWEMVIKNIQEYILEYFRTNQIAESDNNIVSYDFPYDFANHKYKYKHELTENISKIIENSFIPYRCCTSGLSNIHGGEYLHLLNSIPFLERLATQISYPTMTLSLCFSEYQHEYGDYHFITTLQLEFNLKEDVQYETGKNKIIDFLLNKRREKEEKEARAAQAQRAARQYAPKGFNFDDVCKTVTDKHLNVQNIREENKCKELSDIYEFSLQLDLYEVCALLQLQGAFEDKSKIVEYPYVHYYGMQSGTHYEFTKEESSQLSRLLGFKDDELVFIYKNYNIYIVFDEKHKLDIPVKVLEKCKSFLAKNREKSHDDILDCVTKNKAKIIDHCLHVLKCEKQYPSEDILCKKTRHIPLLDDVDDDKYSPECKTVIQNLLVIDPGIITIDLENKVNNILGLQGFKLLAYIDRHNEDRDEWSLSRRVHEDICHYGIYMKFPADLINLR